MPIVYRAIKGSNLTPTEVDGNFHDLDDRVASVESGVEPISIDHFTVTGDQLLVYLTDSSVKGPYTVPTAEWNPRGEWLPVTLYARLDVVSFDGTLYLVDNPHTSAGSFDPSANGGPGVPFYSEILTTPALQLPTGGEQNMRLRKSSSADFATEWEYDTRLISFFHKGMPSDSEKVHRYVTPEAIALPHSLPGSVGSADEASSSDVTFTIKINGSSVGTISFHSGSNAIFALTGDHVMLSGDVLEIIAPSTHDATLGDVACTIVAVLLGG